MRLQWIENSNNEDTGSCYSGVNFRSRRMLTFTVTYKPKSIWNDEPACWIVKANEHVIGSHDAKHAAKNMAQDFLDDFIRGLFAADDY